MWWNGSARHPRGSAAGAARPTSLASPRSRLLSRRGKARAAMEPFRPRTDTRTRLDRQVRAIPLRQRGARTSRRSADRQHLRRGHRRLQSRRRAAVRRDRRRVREACCWPHDAGRRHASGPVFYTPSRRRRRARRCRVDRRRRHAVASCEATRRSVELAADGSQWRVDGEAFDRVVLACPAARRRRFAGVTRTVGRHDAGSGSHRRRCVVDTGDPGRRLAAATCTACRATSCRSRSNDWSRQSRSARRSGPTGPAQTTWSFEYHWAATGCPRCTSPTTTSSRMPSTSCTCISVSMCSRSAVRTSRWPGAFPQYRPHHGATIAAAERSLPGGIALAGASYHGIGIPACIRSGQLAAAATLQR